MHRSALNECGCVGPMRPDSELLPQTEATVPPQGLISPRRVLHRAGVHSLSSPISLCRIVSSMVVWSQPRAS